MDAQSFRRFRDRAAKAPSAEAVRALAAHCAKGTSAADDRLALAAALTHAAFAAPERLVEIYDAAAHGWRGADVQGPAIPFADHAPAPISEALWTEVSAVFDVNTAPVSPGDVTTRTAALAAFLDEGLTQRMAAAAAAYPGVAEAASHGAPPRFTLAALAACPTDSLGGAFHNLIVDNNFDLEVLDRDALGLADLPAPLDYLNARILQCHDLWHIVAGYRTTALHEVGVSGFQLAQFGHGYSAIFLAVTAARTAIEPGLFGLIMDVTLDAWRHGRQTPALVGVDWPGVWTGTIEEVRARLGVEPFASPHPADLFEQLKAA